MWRIVMRRVEKSQMSHPYISTDSAPCFRNVSRKLWFSGFLPERDMNMIWRPPYSARYCATLLPIPPRPPTSRYVAEESSDNGVSLWDGQRLLPQRQTSALLTLLSVLLHMLPQAHWQERPGAAGLGGIRRLQLNDSTRLQELPGLLASGC